MKNRFCGLLAAAAFAGLLVQPAHAGDQKKCQLVERAGLPMTLSKGGLPVITAKMNGQDIPMLVDTGGVFSLVTRQTVDLLHLKPENVPEHALYMGKSGQSLKSMVNVDNFKIGTLSAPYFSFLILPYGWDDLGVGGAIGADIIAQYDAEFDFGGMKLHLWSKDHCPGRVVYWTQQPYMALPFRFDDSKHIIFKVILDGREMDALLDTSSDDSVLRLDIARAMLGWNANPPELKCSDTGAPCHYPFKTLAFGGVAVANPNIEIQPDRLANLHEPGELHERTGGMQAPPIIIGASILRKMHLYIAYGEHVIYATGADAH